MSETFPDFDGPRDDPAPAVPKRSRRTAKKKAKRATPASKPAKRVAKKRRARKPIQYATAKQKAAAGRAFAEATATPYFDSAAVVRMHFIISQFMDLTEDERNVVISAAKAQHK